MSWRMSALSLPASLRPIFAMTKLQLTSVIDPCAATLPSGIGFGVTESHLTSACRYFEKVLEESLERSDHSARWQSQLLYGSYCTDN